MLMERVKPHVSQREPMLGENRTKRSLNMVPESLLPNCKCI